MGGSGQMLPPEARLPPTPESPAEPTFLPHVREPLASLAGHTLGANAEETPTSCADTTSSMLTGLNVLLHERDALLHLHRLYATSPEAQAAFKQAVIAVVQAVRCGGKLIVSGVGKSGKIGQKLVATCNSLQVRAAWLHATEAVHGDMGVISPNDVVLLLSFSATTPELFALLPHLPPSLPLLALTGYDSIASGGRPCPLFAHRPPSEGCVNILLRAPIPVSEVAAFGVAAPTTSTTVALALGDALALAIAHELHDRPAEVFRRCHPGGSIGAARR